MTAKYRLNGGSRDAFSRQTSIIDLVHVKSSACVDYFAQISRFRLLRSLL